MSNRLQSTPDAKATRDQLAKAGGLKLTAAVGEVQQQAQTPRRRKPSLPTVSMEGATKGRRKPVPEPEPMSDEAAMAAYAYAAVEEAEILSGVAEAKARLKGQGKPRPVDIPERRDVAEVVTQYVSAGADRTKAPERRALTHAERQHLNGQLAFAEIQAANTLRHRFLSELGVSEGVGSYDPSARPSPGWQTADRKAVRILNRNRSNRSMLSDLLFSIAGLYDTEGRKCFDIELATLVVKAVIETVDSINATQIGAARTNLRGEKQQPAAGGAILREALRRGAAHLGFTRLPDFDEQWSWRVLTSGAK